MDRLLTEEEYDQIGEPDADVDSAEFEQEVFKAQDAKTKRLVCEGLAEWLEQPCGDKHGNHGPRITCPLCQVEWLTELRKGLMPGEKV